MNLSIKNANKWFELNSSQYFAGTANLCSEFFLENYEYLVSDTKSKAVVLKRDVKIKSNQKVIFPIDIDIVSGTIMIDSKKQGNLSKFPKIIEGELIVENCQLYSLSGSVKKVQNLFVSHNNIDSLEGMPNCKHMNISFNPIKDFSYLQTLKNNELKSLTLSLSHLTNEEVFSVLQQLVNYRIADITIEDNITMSKYKLLGIKRDNIIMDNGVFKYRLNQENIRNILLEKELNENMPLNTYVSDYKIIKF